MALSPEEQLVQLDNQLQARQRELRKLDAYYEGEQPLKYMAPALEAEFGGRIAQVVINWPQMVADAYESRLDVTGFRWPDSGDDDDDEAADEADADLMGIWQDNGMEEQSQQAHLETIVLGGSYAIVGHAVSDGAPPLITVEHPTQCITAQDPATRKDRAGLKRYKGDDKLARAALYLPNENRYYRRSRKWEEIVDERVEHGLGEPLMVRLLNRGRMLRDFGKSEFASILNLADAANKMATDMMVSGEFHATPRRWLFGMAESDFVDENGRSLNRWQQVAGQIWSTEKHPDEVKTGQFPESDLQVFHNTIRALAQLVAQLAALPPHYMSFSTDNPASADAIRSSEAQLVKRVERKQTSLGASWRQVMRLALRLRDGDFDPRARRMEVVWRDASTPTVAQAADAAVKKYTSKITTLQQTREDLQYTPRQIRRMRAEDEAADARSPAARLAQSTLALADRRAGEPADADGA